MGHPLSVLSNVSQITKPDTTIPSQEERYWVETRDSASTNSPARNIEMVRKDRCTAKIYIISKDLGKVVLETDKFLLTAVQQAKTEKVQLMETFDENSPSILFFGKKTMTYSFGGILMNAGNKSNSSLQWVQKFQNLWDNYLRGSILSRNQQYALMTVDNEMYTGYPITFTISKQSVTDETATFSMTWIITAHESLLDADSLEDGIPRYVKRDSLLIKLRNYSIINNIFKIVRRKVSENFSFGNDASILGVLDNFTKIVNETSIFIKDFRNSYYFDPLKNKYTEMTSVDDSGEYSFYEDVVLVLNQPPITYNGETLMLLDFVTNLISTGKSTIPIDTIVKLRSYHYEELQKAYLDLKEERVTQTDIDNLPIRNFDLIQSKNTILLPRGSNGEYINNTYEDDGEYDQDSAYQGNNL